MATPTFAPGDLAGLDALDVDALVIPLFEARAQPLGVAGYIDWRLSGRIARLVHGGRFTGARGELLLMTALDRVGAARLLLWGLGSVASWAKADLGAGFGKLVRVLVDAAVTSAAIAIPTALAGQTMPAATRAAWQASPAWAALGTTRVLLLDAGASRASAPPPPPAA